MRGDEIFEFAVLLAADPASAEVACNYESAKVSVMVISRTISSVTPSCLLLSLVVIVEGT